MDRRNVLGLIGGVTVALPLYQPAAFAATKSGQPGERKLTEQDRNKQIVRDYFDRCFNQGDLEFGRSIIAENYNFHIPAPPNTPRGFEAWKKGVGMFRIAFPDCHWEIHQILAEGDLVSVRTVWTGTHSGPWMGVQASGRRVTAANSDYYRLQGGKFVEHWDVPDYLAMLRQIGGTLDRASSMYAGSTDP